MKTRQIRFVGLIMALILGDFLYSQTRGAWSNYWLMTDSQQGIATITKPYWGGHNQYDYQYTVDGKIYTGTSYRNWRDLKYSDVQPVQEAIVYFSASHPSLSQLYKPDVLIQGMPVLVIVLIFEFFAIVTIIHPLSGWAFNFKGK